MVILGGGSAQNKMSKSKHPFDGMHGGDEYKDNGNGNGNGPGHKKKTQQYEQGSEKEKIIKEHVVYKYNKDIPLAEQIILGSKSVLLQIDKKNKCKSVVQAKLDLSESQGIILIPQQDGMSGVASFTLPIKFKDMKEINEIIELAKHETIDSIYLKHKGLWQKFVVTNDEYTLIFLAIDSVYSNFQDQFETTHYDLIDGMAGSGKGVVLITFQLLGYRVVLAADYSGANILDLYGSNGRCQITVAEDELDDIEEDVIKRKIYKIG